MFIREIVLSALLVASSGAAFAQQQQQGTPEQRAACSPDVRKFCYKLGKNADSSAYEQCLRMNHDKLSEPCRIVFDGK